MFISKGNVNIRRANEWTVTDQNDTVEPCYRVVLVNTMWGTNSGTSLLSPRNSDFWPPHNHVESIPNIPILGLYLAPRSMCSWIPKPKLPVSEKFFRLNSYSFTLRPRSRISSAFGPRMVTCAAIFSFRRIPN